ncbi:MAG: AMP phosphorylase [Nanoarchaeota archaeon]|nr:AMP phosphorylase [Nanoarchaeota archaeon]
MKLKFKLLKLEAGRPIAFVNKGFAEQHNIHEGERIEITYNGKKLILIVDLAEQLLTNHQISLSREATSFLGVKEGEEITVSLALSPKSTRYILKKLEGKELNNQEIREIINAIINNSLTEAEIAYFVSGVYEHGMSFEETLSLTEAMAKTGKVLHWHSNNIADKHSIGGIPGNRTTPIVISICAAAGIIMPKTSSRAITSAAGTADVIETLANVNLSAERLREIVKKTNACLAWGGSLGLAPADDKLIRVERLLNIDPEAQLIASIIAKKISAGSKHILIDIPYGNGAKVSFGEAKLLSKEFLKVASHFKLNIKVILTDGSQPIGNGLGPVLEMLDVISVLKQQNPPKDLEEKSILLAATILEMMKKAPKGQGRKLAKEILTSGRALKKFNEIIDAQGRKKTLLKPAKFTRIIKSKLSGKVISIDNKSINLLARILGCPSDHAAGIYLNKHVGNKIKREEPLLTLYSESKEKLAEGINFFNSSHPIKIKIE